MHLRVEGDNTYIVAIVILGTILITLIYNIKNFSRSHFFTPTAPAVTWTVDEPVHLQPRLPCCLL